MEMSASAGRFLEFLYSLIILFIQTWKRLTYALSFSLVSQQIQFLSKTDELRFCQPQNYSTLFLCISIFIEFIEEFIVSQEALGTQENPGSAIVPRSLWKFWKFRRCQFWPLKFQVFSRYYIYRSNVTTLS